MPDHAREIIRAFGSERVMFGSDYPMWSRRPELEYLRRLDLNKEEYEDICWRTCTQLFKEEHIQCQTEIKNT
jgi:predicted TIM-barrel fold metal-dependent hydrolase